MTNDRFRWRGLSGDDSRQADGSELIVEWVERGLGAATTTTDSLPATSDGSRPSPSSVSSRAAEFIGLHPAWSLTYMSVVLMSCAELEDADGRRWRDEVGDEPDVGADDDGARYRPEMSAATARVVELLHHAGDSSARRSLRGRLAAMVRSMRSSTSCGAPAEVLVCRAALAAAGHVLARPRLDATSTTARHLARRAVGVADASLESGTGRIVEDARVPLRGAER